MYKPSSSQGLWLPPLQIDYFFQSKRISVGHPTTILDPFFCPGNCPVTVQAFPKVLMIFSAFMMSMWFTVMILEGSISHSYDCYTSMSFFKHQMLPHLPLIRKPPDPFLSLTWPNTTAITSVPPNTEPLHKTLVSPLILHDNTTFADTVIQQNFFQFASPLTTTCENIIPIRTDECITFPSINTVSHSHHIQPHEMDPCAFFTLHQNTFSVIWDTGATQSISGYASDFVGPILAPSAPLRLGGIASGLDVAGIGTVKWIFVSDDGRLLTLNLQAYYVPACK